MVWLIEHVAAESTPKIRTEFDAYKNRCWLCLCPSAINNLKLLERDGEIMHSMDETTTDAAFERETTITLSDGDTLVRIWTSQHHVIQHLRKDKRFTETTDPSRCTTEEAEFTIPRTEWTPWGGAKHRRQLTDKQQIREQVAADIWEYWPFRRTARYREASCHSTGEYRQAPRIRRRTRPDHLSRKRPPL